MSALVDTSIWSLALRREQRELNHEQQRLLAEWKTLVGAGGAFLIGPIRQEILSGIRDHRAFDSLLNWLRFFDVISVVLEDYDQAAMFFNLLREQGVSASPIDVLICAVARRCDIPVFTTDEDFRRYAEHLPIRL